MDYDYVDRICHQLGITYISVKRCEYCSRRLVLYDEKLCCYSCITEIKDWLGKIGINQIDRAVLETTVEITKSEMKKIGEEIGI